ncbi:MAG: hypothetical protein OHK0013_22680 [Sandaracinaceae bacterium]
MVDVLDSDELRATLVMDGVQNLVILLLTMGLVGWGHTVAARYATLAWRMVAWLPFVAMLVLYGGVGATLAAIEPALAAFGREAGARSPLASRIAPATAMARVAFSAALML